MLNEWVLKQFNDVEIYGQWEDERALEDRRFVGSKKLEELQPLLQKTKYTFIIPIAKGWVTSKYIEMIHNGVIPFFHPTYDEQEHTGVPKFLRVKTPDELRKKIDWLNKNPDQYKILLTKMQKVLKSEYYDGSFISKMIMSNIVDDYELPDLTKYKKQETHTLEDFFFHDSSYGLS